MSRLFFIPTFAVFSFLSRLKAVRRRILKLASAFPFLIRHWSGGEFCLSGGWSIRSNSECLLTAPLCAVP